MPFIERHFVKSSLAVRCALLLFGGLSLASAADVDKTRALFAAGNYAEVLRVADQIVNKDTTFNYEWPSLLARAQLALGRYPDALTTVTNALRHFRTIQLELVAYDVFNANGLTQQATEMLDDLGRLARSRMRSDTSPTEFVALGKALLLLNAEPKLVLENFFDEARRRDPNNRDARLAAGELALDKHDYALAAKIFNEAIKKFPDDPDVLFGLARAYAPSDRRQMAEALDGTLDANTNHVPCLLLIADQMIDAEDYAEADNMIERALMVNPWQPEAWAYRAVLGHIRNDAKAETSARQTALRFWKTNPRVDNLIGLKLSQKYRFLEGSIYQRQALKFEPEYLPAKIQLAQDLLRLGQEPEGWRLANEVHQRDGYDVSAFNLVALHDTMSKYQTVTNGDFILRMTPREAAIYGDRALGLLQRAHDRLSEKYGFHPDQPTMVEIFAEQKDFGVRTFGIPDNPGFLGVCFGHVVTANSPASQADHPANWEAVLWHEFCHVITLGITRNKMPRWISEGISVYEERQANPTWGQTINPHYREMILGGDLTPVSKLSSAFMNPKTPGHIQFAYYESSLVVEYLVQKFGFEALKQILADLGDGVDINETIARRAAPMEKFEKGFAAYALERATNMAPGLDWKKPRGSSPVMSLIKGDSASEESEPPLDNVSTNRPGSTNNPDQKFYERYGIRRPRPAYVTATNSIAQVRPGTDSGTNKLPSVLQVNPDGTHKIISQAETPARMPAVPVASATPSAPLPNYWKLMEQAETALSDKKWREAKVPLTKLIDLYPAQTGEDSAYAMLAAAQRGLNETNEERETLAKLASMEDDDLRAYSRLMELDEAGKDWEAVTTNSERYLAVNPLVPQPYRFLARASEEKGQSIPAVRSYQRLLMLDPPDLADAHFRLARQLRKLGDYPAAKRQTLEALEEAPRFHAAQRLLLEIENFKPSATPAAPSDPSHETKP